jgi:hypothetical protein
LRNTKQHTDRICSDLVAWCRATKFIARVDRPLCLEINIFSTHINSNLYRKKSLQLFY